MTMETKSGALLDRCVNLAADFGCLRAAEKDATKTFTDLNEAIDRFIESLGWLPVEERPERAQVVRMMVRNSFLMYRHALGELSVEELPEAFASLEINFP